MAPPKMVYQLRITLFDSAPKIWRRILIPTSATFWDLHSAIQDVFQWNHSHLHQFAYHDKLFKKYLIFGIPTADDEILDLIVFRQRLAPIAVALCLASTVVLWLSAVQPRPNPAFTPSAHDVLQK